MGTRSSIIKTGDIALDYNNDTGLYSIQYGDESSKIVMNSTDQPYMAMSYAAGALDVLSILRHGQVYYYPVKAEGIPMTERMFKRCAELG